MKVTAERHFSAVFYSVEAATLASQRFDEVISPTQNRPSPVNPALHVQVNEPTVFSQTESAWQRPLKVLHSSISETRKKSKTRNLCNT